MSAYVLEYEDWDDDTDSTSCLVGPFLSQAAVNAWVKNYGWASDYDPRWHVRTVRSPWLGVMQTNGSVTEPEVSV